MWLWGDTLIQVTMGGNTEKKNLHLWFLTRDESLHEGVCPRRGQKLETTEDL